MRVSGNEKKIFGFALVLLVFSFVIFLSSCSVISKSHGGRTLTAPTLKIDKMYANGVDLSWNPINKAKGYILFLFNSNDGKEKELKFDKNKNEIHVDMKTGQKYRCFLKAFNDSVLSSPSNVLEITPLYTFSGKWIGKAYIRKLLASLSLNVSQKDGKCSGILAVKNDDGEEEKKYEISVSLNVLNGNVEFFVEGRNRDDVLNFKGKLSTDNLTVEGYIHSQLNCHDVIVGSWKLEKKIF